MAVDPHCFDADPDPDPAQNLPRIQIQIRGGGEGVGQPKMCIPPGQILGTPLCGGVSCDINDMKRKPREMSQLGKKYYWNIKNNSAFRNYDRNTTGIRQEYDRNTTGRQTEDPRWIYDINKERTTGQFLFKINYSQTCRKMFFSQKKFVIFTHSKFFKQRVNVGFKWNCYCWHKFF
jgi:hypothetical protein